MRRVEYAFMGVGTCGSTYVAAVYLLYILYLLCVPVLACSSFCGSKRPYRQEFHQK